MKTHLSDRRFLVVTTALLAASLACSAPAGQQAPQSQATPSQEVAQAFTSTPYVVTATPEAVVVTATPPPPAAPATTGGSTGGTTGGSTGGSGSTSGGSTGGSTGGSGSTSGGSGGTDCGYDSQFVADLTVPDGTNMLMGSSFTKTWRVKNSGCHIWPSGTSLIYISGNQMGGPAGVPVPETASGGTQDISVNLTTPGTPGNKQGKWQLRTPDGIQFGDKLTVKISAVALPPPAIAPSATPTTNFTVIVPLIPIGPLLIANFTAAYAGDTGGCIGFGSAYWVKVKNTGGFDFESASTTFEAPVGTSVSSGDNDSPFTGSMACGSSNSTLAAGDTGYVIGGATAFSGPASGTNAKITVKLCTADGEGGTCVTRNVTFTIP